MSKGQIAGREPVAVQVEKGKDYWWCACGLSKSQPFCDGSHKAEGKFTPVQWTAPKSGERWFCTCKQTNNAPFCDSSHKTLQS
jgi:CDGSH iron-sulfur domain-containing protein 3